MCFVGPRMFVLVAELQRSILNVVIFKLLVFGCAHACVPACGLHNCFCCCVVCLLSCGLFEFSACTTWMMAQSSPALILAFDVNKAAMSADGWCCCFVHFRVHLFVPFPMVMCDCWEGSPARCGMLLVFASDAFQN